MLCARGRDKDACQVKNLNVLLKGSNAICQGWHIKYTKLMANGDGIMIFILTNSGFETCVKELNNCYLDYSAVMSILISCSNDTSFLSYNERSWILYEGLQGRVS